MKKLLVLLALSNLICIVNAEENKSTKAKNLLLKLDSKIEKSFHNSEASNEELTALNCISDELQFDRINKSFFGSLKMDLAERKNIEKYFTDKLKGHNLSNKNIKSQKNFDGITQKNFEFKNIVKSRPQIIKGLTNLLKEFKKIENLELIPLNYISSIKNRASNKQMKSLITKVNLDIRGIASNGARTQVRGELNLNLNNVNGKWLVSELNVLKLESLERAKSAFTNITASSGINKLVPSHLRREAIRRGGYAMAVSDFNKDKNIDIMVSTVAESVLLEGKKSGGFTSNKSSKDLINKNFVKAASFTDLDNDGIEELLMVRFAPDEDQSSDRSDIVILKNKNGKFVKQKNKVKFDHKTAYAMPLALADFDNNGLVDFYVGFPGAKDFTTLEEAKHQNGLVSQGVFYNNGSMFTDISEKSLILNNPAIGGKEDLSRIFPHSAVAMDYDLDGNIDLVVIDDRGNLSPIYKNKGNGNFELSSEKIGVGLKDYGMGVDASDINGDGKLDFVMSSVNFTSAARLKSSCEMNWSQNDIVQAGVSGLRLFEGNINNSKYIETTNIRGLEWAGEGLGGVKFVDYNNDGLEDIYVVNGLWSGSEKSDEQDISTQFIVASHLNILEDDLRSPLKDDRISYGELNKGNDYKSLLFRSDSQSAIMDILSHFRGDVVTKENGKKSPSLAGNQRNRMFRNNGDGTFTEVGYLLGIDSSADGYMVSVSDINRDGKMDFILRNADPGFNVKQFAPVEIYRNDFEKKNNSAVIELVGTKSNRDAIGTTVIAKISGKKITKQLIGNSGTVQSEKIIHIGMGKEKLISELTVKWPSGVIQKFTNITSGRHIIKESSDIKVGIVK